MTDETIFIDGLRVFKPSDKAPDFIILNGEIDMKELREFALNHHDEGKVRFQVKESKGGKYYAALDTFKPQQQAQQQPQQSSAPSPNTEDFDDDIPF